jgi:predicted component of type VI protein secretion system
MAKRKITIEDLARMVKKGFDETAKEEQVINLEKWAKRRFDNIDRELEKIRKQLTGIVYRHEFEKLEARVKNLEDLLAVMPKK